MNPTKHWGTHLWAYIHTISLMNKPEEEVKACLKSIPDVIPCLACQFSFREICNEIDNIDCSGHGLFEWTVDVHNRINKSLGKPELTYEEAISIFMH